MRVLELLKHFELIVDHTLVTSYVLLQNDFHGDFGSILTLSFANNTVGAGAEGSSEFVEGPELRRIPVNIDRD